MIISFGKFHGTPYEQLLFEQPEYILWMLGVNNPLDPLAGAVRKVQQLIDRVGSTPIHLNCNNNECTAKATRCCVSLSTMEPVWYCDNCPPGLSNVLSENMPFLRGYFDFTRYAKLHWKDNHEAFCQLLRHLAKAKGILESPGTYKSELQWPTNQAANANGNQMTGWGRSQWQNRFCSQRWPDRKEAIEPRTTPVMN